MKKFIMKKGFPRLYPTLAEYGLKSSHEVLTDFFPNCPRLQLALNVYWCFMGMNPERFPWSILAKCTYIYMEDKPFYLRGTSMMMSQAILEAAKCMGCVAAGTGLPLANFVIAGSKIWKILSWLNFGLKL